MKTYKVTYKEILIGTHYVEANSEEEAKEIFQQECWNGEVDFSDEELIDMEVSVKEEKE